MGVGPTCLCRRVMQPCVWKPQCANVHQPTSQGKRCALWPPHQPQLPAAHCLPGLRQTVLWDASVFVAEPLPVFGGSWTEEAHHPVPLAPGACPEPRAEGLGHPTDQCIREPQASPLPPGSGERVEGAGGEEGVGWSPVGLPHSLKVSWEPAGPHFRAELGQDSPTLPGLWASNLGLQQGSNPPLCPRPQGSPELLPPHVHLWWTHSPLGYTLGRDFCLRVRRR